MQFETLRKREGSLPMVYKDRDQKIEIQSIVNPLGVFPIKKVDMKKMSLMKNIGRFF